MVSQIYPTELQLNMGDPSDTEALFLNLDLSITNGIVSTKIYDEQDDINFEIVIFRFLSLLFLMYTFRNLFVLQEYVLMLMTSTIETNFWLLNF